MSSHFSRQMFGCLGGLLLLLFFPAAGFCQEPPASPDPLEARLQQRLSDNPEDAATWRMLGRLRLKQGNYYAALNACRQAVELDPHAASHHFDLAAALLALEKPEDAAFHFAEVIVLAPDSDYALQAREKLQELPEPPEQSFIQQASFEKELEPNRFGGAVPFQAEDLDEPELQKQPPQHFSLRLSTGLLFNTNVQLAPLSRDVFGGETSSFQAFVSPKLEYRFRPEADWTPGVIFDSYLTLNEGNFRQYNLQNYRPGIFLEQTTVLDFASLTNRLQYDFTHDSFDGETFGTRQALTASSQLDWLNEQSSFVYWTVDYSNFTEDGQAPAFDSLDGWTNTVGLSHQGDPGIGAWRLLRGGADVQFADLEGANYTYRGIFLYLDSEIWLWEQTWAAGQLGWGYRDYYEFAGAPSRNENLWRAGLELNHRLSERWLLTAFSTYDLFESRNKAFESDRFLGGIKTTFSY